jgi:hypothetical protein
VIGDLVPPGKATIASYFPESDFRRNALAGGLAENYPDDNLFPASIEAAGMSRQNARKWVLSSDSLLLQAGLDGANVGCDLQVVFGKEGAARDGVPQ